MTVTRTLKCQVYFPDVRGEDLKGKEGIIYALARAQGELTRAANQALTALWALRNGLIEHPTTPDDKPVSVRTLAYQCFSGKWSPQGEPCFTPTRDVSGGVKRCMASLVFSRLTKDFAAVRAGRQTLPTFKKVPLTVGAQEATLLPNGRFELRVWAGRRNNAITVAPRLGKRRQGQREVLKRLISGEYKMGDVRLYKDSKTSKWTIAVAWTDPNPRTTEGNVVAGLDLGIATTATIAYVDATTGKPFRFRDRVNIPKDTIRAWNRVTADRRDRLRTNRPRPEVRSGRGRRRKMRVVQHLDTKLGNMVDTTVEQTAAAIVATLLKRGTTLLVLEDLTGITQQKIREYDDLEGRKRAGARKWFLQWQQGALRAAIRNAAEKAGIEVVEVGPAYTSKTCAACGIIWSTSSAHQVATSLGVKTTDITVARPVNGYGRLSQSKFACSCGYAEHADRNAGVNIARRGIGIGMTKPDTASQPAL